MSRFLRTAAMVVGAVALIAATAGTAAPAVAATATSAASAGGIAGISAATLGAIGTYGSLAAGVLSVAAGATAPKASMQGNSTTFQTNPQSGLPYAMGRTRMSGLRIFARTSNSPGYTKAEDLLWFGALLTIGGQIDSIEQFTADNEIVTFSGTGQAAGRFNNWMSQKLHLGGAQASALALTLNGGSPPGWTNAHRLSGITHVMWGLRFDKDGDKFGGGTVPEPAWIGKWVKVYDPRLDSTYPGGSGSCRALNESTYVWSQNAGLHALTWALGRWQNGKRTCGIGAPVPNIRVSDFVECANVCDANAWKVGGVEWTTDSKWDTFKRILQAGGAVPTQTGAMIGCLVSAPRTAIATIESRHLLDGLSIAATKSRRDRFNTVIPRYVDEDSDWAIISGRAVQEPQWVTDDGGARTKEIDYPLVQVFSGAPAQQPGQLAAYDIVNSREAGPITWTTGPEWIGLKTGDVIYLNFPDQGLVNQPVLITRRAPDPSTGKVSFAAETETYSKHAYALGQSTAPPAPFSVTPPDLTPPAPLAAIWSVSGVSVGSGYPGLLVAGANEFPGADYVLIRYRPVGDPNWRDAGSFAAAPTIRQVISPLAGDTAYEVAVAYQSEGRAGPYTTLPAATTPGDGFSLLISDLTTTLDAKRTVFIRPTAPTAAESEENDWWQQTDGSGAVIATYRRVAGSGRLSIGGNAITLGGNYIVLPWAPLEDQRIANALSAATAASDLADSKAVVFTMFASTDPVPVGTDNGDVLVRAYLNPVQLDYWNGTTWVPAATFGATAAQISAIGQALTDAANAQETADGKIDTFYQPTAPTGASIGDLWFDTDDGRKQYRFDGMVWVVVQDAAITAAITAAAGAQETADGKIDTFYQDDAPGTASLGDLWFDTNDGRKIYRYNGSAWVAAQDAGIAQAISDAAGAQASADGKITTYYSDFPPGGASEGDLWIETDNGNILYRHNGSGWLQIRDTGIGQALTAAAGAQGTADGKVTTYVGESLPVSPVLGDLWFKASTHILSRWNGATWATVSSVGAPAGTSVGGTGAGTVADGANAANNGVNADGTVKTDRVATPAIVANAVNEASFVTLPSDIAMSNFADNAILTLTVTGVQAGELIKAVAAFSLYSTNDLAGEVFIKHTPPGGAEYALRRQPQKIDGDGVTATYLTLPVVARHVATVSGSHIFKLGYYPTPTSGYVCTAKAGTDFEITRQKK